MTFYPILLCHSIYIYHKPSLKKRNKKTTSMLDIYSILSGQDHEIKKLYMNEIK